MNTEDLYLKASYMIRRALNPGAFPAAQKDNDFSGRCSSEDAEAYALYADLCRELAGDKAFYDYCASQGVEGIVSCAMEDAFKAGYIGKSEYKRWDDRRSQIIYRNLMFELEREKIFSMFTEQEICFMPLKGIILNELYPAPGMRASGDNDILIDGSKETAVSILMQGSGYSCEESGNSCHSIYSREPFLVFEMHIALMKSGMEVSRKRARAIKEYYLKIGKRLVQDKDNPCRYSFTPEDFYIFHLVHVASHFNTSGMSLRFLTDTYVLLEKYQKTYDRGYINEVMDRFMMRDFEDMMRNLSLKLFSPHQECRAAAESALTEKEKSALEYIAMGKTFRNHNRALGIQMSMISQGVDSYGDLTETEEEFSFSVKLKYLLLYFAQMCDEIEVNLISTQKSTLLLPWVLIKKALFKLKHHSDTIREFVSER